MATVKKVKAQERPEIPITRPDLFTRVAGWTIRATGGRWGFLTALLAVIIWAISGPFFDYSANWQLVINTGTTIVTFLMVFLIQNAQNRESKATHLKLDELILAVNRARNEMIDIENLPEEKLDLLAERYHKIAEQHQHKVDAGIVLEKKTVAASSNGHTVDPAPAHSGSKHPTPPKNGAHPHEQAAPGA